MTDENIIVRAARAQREVWETIEQQDAEINRLRGLITEWAVARDAADRGEERDEDDGLSAEKYAQAQETALRGAVER